jgi:hypothetical protein
MRCERFGCGSRGFAVLPSTTGKSAGPRETCVLTESYTRLVLGGRWREGKERGACDGEGRLGSGRRGDVGVGGEEWSPPASRRGFRVAMGTGFAHSDAISCCICCNSIVVFSSHSEPSFSYIFPTLSRRIFPTPRPISFAVPSPVSHPSPAFSTFTPRVCYRFQNSSIHPSPAIFSLLVTFSEFSRFSVHR